MLLLMLILFLLAGGVVAALAYENLATLAVDVHLTFFAWHLPALPLGALLLISCALGALLLYVVTLVSAMRERRELRRLRRRIAELEAMQPTQPVQPMQRDGTHLSQPPPQVILPMPGTQTYRLQYLFPPPAPERKHNQGK